MGKDETTTAGTTVIAADEEVAPMYWNHMTTFFLIIAINNMYAAQVALLVAGGAFSRAIAAVVGGMTLTSWGVAGGASPLLHAITSEILPRKYRSRAQAIVTSSGGLGCLLALLLAGFRNCFNACAGRFAFAAIAPALLYNPPPRELQIRLPFGEKLRALDWMAYFPVNSGPVLVCLGLLWA
ncbi:hypothetical protein BKA61DRAFT_662623 [Leptodontidium sp. MPI-SDFR-AT-0119]|nr:hypothetical protein BKA61DRAFT_662623 [Leptodontidium sp. MPI-SDFR-AT-0119]